MPKLKGKSPHSRHVKGGKQKEGRGYHVAQHDAKIAKRKKADDESEAPDDDSDGE